MPPGPLPCSPRGHRGVSKLGQVLTWSRSSGSNRRAYIRCLPFPLIPPSTPPARLHPPLHPSPPLWKFPPSPPSPLHPPCRAPAPLRVSACPELGFPFPSTPSAHLRLSSSISAPPPASASACAPTVAFAVAPAGHCNLGCDRCRQLQPFCVPHLPLRATRSTSRRNESPSPGLALPTPPPSTPKRLSKICNRKTSRSSHLHPWQLAGGGGGRC